MGKSESGIKLAVRDLKKNFPKIFKDFQDSVGIDINERGVIIGYALKEAECWEEADFINKHTSDENIANVLGSMEDNLYITESEIQRFRSKLSERDPYVLERVDKLLAASREGIVTTREISREEYEKKTKGAAKNASLKK